ncbi:alpha/beta fold hydrolase [Paraburkholderia sp.]|uniref:alpha/beta fold hydrolase n=1 Tax=Paraburkholderia sp. TaxID=1926495 RepID=UPI003C7DDB34
MNHPTPSERLIHTEDGCLWCEVNGDGMPVILLHGFSFDSTSWDSQFECVASDYRAVRYDLSGFGRSTNPVGHRGHVDDFLAVCADLKINDAHLVGLSLGANVALSVALQHPKLVRSLVLASPGLPGYTWTEERPPDAVKRYADTHGVDAAKLYWYNHPIFSAAREQPNVAAALWAMIDRYSGWHWLNSASVQPLVPVADRLAKVQCPTLIINGDRDVSGYRGIGRFLSMAVTGATHVEFQGAGHLVNMEQPQRFNEAMLCFLKSIER